MTEKPTPIPAEILQFKDELKDRWDQLPVEHQAVFVLNLLRETLSGEYQLWMVVALRVMFPDVWHDLDS
jgi:hypothetical protein